MIVQTRFQRLVAVSAAVLGALAIALAFASWLVDRNALRSAVEQQVRAATGLTMTTTGPTEVSLFPSSYVTLRQVVVRANDTDTPALNADELKAGLGLFSLLTGRYQVSNISLNAPRINVAVDADGHNNWSPVLDTLAQTLKPGAAQPVSFSDIRLSGGTLSYRNDTRHVAETVDGVDLTLSLPSISRALSASGHGTWHDEQIEGSFTVADFLNAISGERSGLKVRIASRPLQLSYDGVITNRASVLLEGTVAADSKSLRDAMRWMGQEPPGDNGFGAFSLRARANVVGESVALTNVNVSLDGNAAEGVLTYNNTTGQRTLQGTLAADAVDFTPYVSTVRLLATGAREWNRQAFDLRGLSSTDLDIRLSAAKVLIGSTRLGRTAVGANLRNGTLALSVGEAQIFSGLIRGSLSAAKADDGVSVKSQFQFSDIDMETGGSELFGIRNLKGRGDLTVSLEAAGASPFALAQSLDGTATLTAHDGVISGFNIEQLLRRLERRPLSGAGSFRSGTTPFSKLKIGITINDGTATADDVSMDGPSTHVTLTGTASIPSREYDLKGSASLTSTGDAPPEFQLPFVILGPWDDPSILPDSDILIRRSTVTRPLLDSLKDHTTRDAVRAVLDRLQGGKKPADPAPAADTPAAAPSASETPAASPPAPAAAPAN